MIMPVITRIMLPLSLAPAWAARTFKVHWMESELRIGVVILL